MHRIYLSIFIEKIPEKLNKSMKVRTTCMVTLPCMEWPQHTNVIKVSCMRQPR